MANVLTGEQDCQETGQREQGVDAAHALLLSPAGVLREHAARLVREAEAIGPHDQAAAYMLQLQADAFVAAACVLTKRQMAEPTGNWMLAYRAELSPSRLLDPLPVLDEA